MNIPSQLHYEGQRCIRTTLSSADEDAGAHVWWPRLEHELEDLVNGCPITLVINHMY